MPFEDESFDLVWMQNVGMNIADKVRLYAEIARVLRSGGRFALQDLLAGEAPLAYFPLPWATTAGESFLPTADGLSDLLATAGLREIARREVPAAPPAPGMATISPLSYLIWGEAAGRMIDENIRRSVAEGRVTGAMLVAERS